MRRVLLGQLGARGDCLYASAIARQIKADDPDCHLTWAVGTHCASLVEGCPYVDALWLVPVDGHHDIADAWRAFEIEAQEKKASGEFDQIYLSQIYPNNFANFDGTVRASILRAYGAPMTVSLKPWVQLTAQELNHAEQFWQHHQLDAFDDVVLFEYASLSEQSFVTPALAMAIATAIIDRRPATAVVMSSAEPLTQLPAGVFDGSTLSFKENAALAAKCALLVGCSSGISWLCEAANDPPPAMIQLLKQRDSVYASFVHDHDYHNLPSEHVIEMTDCPAERVVDCVCLSLDRGIAIARQDFHQSIAPSFVHYGQLLMRTFAAGELTAAWSSIKVTVARYGPRPALLMRALWASRGYLKYLWYAAR